MSDAEMRLLVRRPPPETLRWAAGAVGSGTRITSLTPMRRSSSTAMHALNVVDRRGRRHRLALRRFVRADRLENETVSYSPGREAEVLRLLEGSRVPAPVLVAADPSAQACDVPTLLTTRLPGGPAGEPTDMEAFLTQLAEAFSAIRAVNGRASALAPYERYYALEEIEPPPWSERGPMWERVLEVISTPPPETSSSFIHRDYHHHNTLWSRGRLTGVVDWTTGCWGPPSIDLGRMRQNLAWDFSVEAADRFLALCRSQVGETWEHHPYWELVDAADSLHDYDPPRTREEWGEFSRFETYVASVIAQL